MLTTLHCLVFLILSPVFRKKVHYFELQNQVIDSCFLDYYCYNNYKCYESAYILYFYHALHRDMLDPFQVYISHPCSIVTWSVLSPVYIYSSYVQHGSLRLSTFIQSRNCCSQSSSFERYRSDQPLINTPLSHYPQTSCRCLLWSRIPSSQTAVCDT